MATTRDDETGRDGMSGLDADDGAERTATGRATVRGILTLVVPPLAWIASLAASYVIQDFGCAAYTSADSLPPRTAMLVGITVVNVLLLLATIVCGVVAWRESRRPHGVRQFLGYVGVSASVILGWGIVLIAVNPFVLEVCP